MISKKGFDMKQKILLGITGGIAAYKAIEIARAFIKKGYEVFPVMTKHATEFVQPLTFEVITSHKVGLDLFQRDLHSHIPHIDLARETDIMLIAPATANIIAKTNAGLCDDLLSTLIVATTSPIVFAPAMNKEMYLNAITQKNIESIKKIGYHFIEPESGELACKEEGIGRLASIETITDETIKILNEK